MFCFLPVPFQHIDIQDSYQKKCVMKPFANEGYLYFSDISSHVKTIILFVNDIDVMSMVTPRFHSYPALLRKTKLIFEKSNLFIYLCTRKPERWVSGLNRQS